MKDEKIFEYMKEKWKNYRENPVKRELLEALFSSMKGNIYCSPDENVAVGFYPTMEGLQIVFFKILEDDKLKVTDLRGIGVDEAVVQEIDYALQICLDCNTKKNAKLSNQPTLYHQ